MSRDHPSSFVLESFSVRGLGDAEHAAVARHLQECATCRDYVAALEARQAEMVAELPPAAFARLVELRANVGVGFWARLRTIGSLPTWALATTAAVLLIAVVPIYFSLLPSVEKTATLRSMGGLAVRLELDRTGPVRPDPAGVAVRTGDGLRVEVVPPAAGYLCVFFMTDQGDLSWLLPDNDDAPASSVPAREWAVPGSAVFDASTRPERLFVLFDRSAFSPRERAARIRQAWQAQPQDAFATEGWIPREVETWTALFIKERP